MSEVSTIGLDLAKNVFRVHGADASGAVLVRKKLRRAQPLRPPAREGLSNKISPSVLAPASTLRPHVRGLRR